MAAGGGDGGWGEGGERRGEGEARFSGGILMGLGALDPSVLQNFKRISAL